MGVALWKTLFRAGEYIEKNPKAAFARCAALVGLVFSYEVIVEHNNRVPSPLVSNHLEYEMETNGALPRFGLKTKDTAADERSNRQEATLFVRKTQIEDREPHWKVRNAERNWSVMSRDMQKQKDSFTYRALRSQDDDYLRNTFEK